MMSRTALALALALVTLALAGCGKQAEKLGVDVAITAIPTVTPSAPTSDDTIAVQFNIGNVGTKDVGPVGWTAYFEDDPIASGTTPALAAGTGTLVSFNLGNVQSGTHNITVVADSSSLIREDNERNNSQTGLVV